MEQEHNLESLVVKYDQVILRHKRNRRICKLRSQRNELVVELYDMRRAHAVYDSLMTEALRDPTGQDYELFCEQHG